MIAIKNCEEEKNLSNKYDLTTSFDVHLVQL